MNSFLVCSGIYNPLSAVGDIKKMYREIGRRGGNKTRLIPDPVWEKQQEDWGKGPFQMAKDVAGNDIWWNNYWESDPNSPLTPLFQLVAESTITVDGKPKVSHPDFYLPKLDLDANGLIVNGSWWDGYLKGTNSAPFTILKNPAWWDRLAQIIGWIGRYVGRYQITIQDGCSHATLGWQKYLNPFKSCAEKRGNPPMAEGVAVFQGGIIDPGYQRFHLIWIKTLVDFCKAQGVPFDIEPWNEIRFASDYSEAYLKSYLTWFHDSIRRCGLPAGTELIANGWPNVPWLAGISDRVSIHGHSRPEDVKANWGVPCEKLIISCDGGYNGDGDADEKGRKGPSPAQLRAMVEKMIPLGYREIEFFPRGVEGQGIPLPHGGVQPNVDAFNYDMVTACVQAAGLPTYEFIEVCSSSGLRPNPVCPTKSERKFIAGQGPTFTCREHVVYYSVCTKSGLLPNGWCRTEVRRFAPGEEPTTSCPDKAPFLWRLAGPHSWLCRKIGICWRPK